MEEEFIKKAWVNDIDEVLPKPVNVDILAEIFKDILHVINEWLYDYHFYLLVILKQNQLL